MGNTDVLFAASVDGRVPPFLRNSGMGWVTAEYDMLPRATHTRGKQSGRTGDPAPDRPRTARSVDRSAMGEVSINARLGAGVEDLDGISCNRRNLLADEARYALGE